MNKTSDFDTVNDFLLSLSFDQRQTILDTLLECPELVPILAEDIRLKLSVAQGGTTLFQVLEYEKKNLRILMKKYGGKN